MYTESEFFKLESWVSYPSHTDFPIQNLPYGVFSRGSENPHCGVALGDYVIDLEYMAKQGYFEGLALNAREVFAKPSLNDFLALGREVWLEVRMKLIELFEASNKRIKDHHEHRSKTLIHKSEVKMHLPVVVGDYTDFYSSKEHAYNVGKLFRPDEPLLPNWSQMPIAYHGRSSSIVISGTPIHRPKGQVWKEPSQAPCFQESEKVDYELEMAFVFGGKHELAEPLRPGKAEHHIFGCLLFNDWSARDIQSWEYKPLGPFTSKNFASTISPWIVTWEALQAFRVAGPAQDPEPLPYLKTSNDLHLDIQLEAELKAGSTSKILCKSNTKYLYWNVVQQLVHHTVTGCQMRAGDLCASGTISGPNEGEQACLLELTEGGKLPVMLPDGSKRTYLQDGDEVTLRAHALKENIRIGFGECKGKIMPAKPYEL